MKGKQTLLNNSLVTNDPKALESVEFLMNPMGVVFNATTKDELLDKISDFFSEEEPYTVTYPPTKSTVAVMTDKETLKHYMEGYKNIAILDNESSSYIHVHGLDDEIKMLCSALSRNCIRVDRVR